MVLKGTKRHCLCGFRGNEEALFAWFKRERRGTVCVVLKGTKRHCLCEFKGNGH